MSPRASFGRIAVGIVALLSLGFGALIGYAPELLPPVVRRWRQTVFEGMDPQSVMVAVGATLAIVGLFSSWSWRTAERSSLFGDVAVESSDRDVRVAGASITGTVEAWADGEASLDGGPLEDPLRDVLVDVYTAEFGDRETARAHVDTGEWTDDRHAAAMLTTTDAVDYPLVHRLYAWLYPGRAYERRARRTLRAVETECAERYSQYDPPERSASRLDRLQSMLLTRRDGDRE